jgi:hypothetical protein
MFGIKTTTLKVISDLENVLLQKFYSRISEVYYELNNLPLDKIFSVFRLHYWKL